MKRNSISSKALAGFMAAAMAVSYAPAAVFADDAEAEVVDLATADEPAEQPEEGGDEAHYVTMNVPYDDFYAAYDLTDKAVWDVNGEGLDAVSTATTSKFLGTTGLANGTYNDGTYILGVSLPVEVDAEEYDQLATDLTVNDNYYFTDLDEAPAAYSELTIGEDGSYSFSALQAYTGSTEGMSVAESANGFLTAGYGDYQIDLEGIRTNGTLANGESYGAIYGAILYTDNGKSLGMTALENLWFGTRVDNVEVAFSIPEGQGLKRGHGSGDAFYQFADINGQKLTGVDVITDLGVISLSADLTLTEYYAGDLSGLTYNIYADEDVLYISGIPAELKDVTISLSNGLADKAAVSEDGEVQLTAMPVAGVNYTMTISSSNFTDITKTVCVSMSAEQKVELKKWRTKGKAVLAQEEDTQLQEHVAEITALLQKKDATSQEAVELINEVKLLVKKHYQQITVKAQIYGSDLQITLDGTALADLENPTFKLTGGSGRFVSTYAEGDLSELEVILENAPAAGTACTLTVMADNIADSAVSVTAQDKIVSIVTLANKSVVYTGKAVAMTGAEVTGSFGAVTYQYYSDAACTKKVAASAVKNAGTYYVKASVAEDSTCTAAVSEAATLKITQATATVKVKTTSKTYKLATVKKAKKAFSIGASVTSKGKLSYKISKYVTSKAKNYLSINKSTGKITVKKGTPKGTYKIKVKITAAKTTNYKAASKTVTIKVVVK